MNIKSILTLNDLPDKTDEKFWDNVDNPEIKGFVVFLMLNTIRNINNPELLNESQAKGLLGKLKAFQELIDGTISIAEELKGDDDITL
jgi:hypothetical protein